MYRTASNREEKNPDSKSPIRLNSELLSLLPFPMIETAKLDAVTWPRTKSDSQDIAPDAVVLIQFDRFANDVDTKLGI